MFMTKPESDVKFKGVDAVDYENIFFSIKEMVKDYSISPRKVYYNIRTGNWFAFHVQRQWRVCPKGFRFVNELYDTFPNTVSVELLGRVLKVKRAVVYGIIDDGVLFPECVAGQIQFTKAEVFDYIHSQSNFSEDY